ncbi:MAG: adenosine kinase [Candidatus Eremiobacteraeota bacterium]|nr:adenosine kinase [Candidatus Eremiobacteraeota bacterium]
MALEPLDVVGIGNAIVDVIAPADDAFLAAHGMTKGAMILVDERRAQAVYAQMASAIISSGGSAGNTIAGIASLGGKTGYIGKVRDDEFGDAFRHDITAAGTIFRTPPASSGPGTAQCLVLVTPDGQRTMNTYLGACVNLVPEDIDEELIRAARCTYLEGYLYDDPSAKRAFARAAEVAHGAGRQVALSLSDALCVERHRADFLRLVDHHVDVLFANEGEIMTLLMAPLEASLARLRQMTQLATVTRGARGSLVVNETSVTEIRAEAVERVVDTTGAGDLYAAGFLFGLSRGATLAQCGRLGSLAAAEAIGHYGARPQTPLHRLVDGVLVS